MRCWTAEITGITTLDDWYNVSKDELVQAGGSSLYIHHGSMYKLLCSVYPSYQDYFITIVAYLTYLHDISGIIPNLINLFPKDIGRTGIISFPNCVN